jgi:hypothetical protein
MKKPLSTDLRTGSSRLQPCYFEPPLGELWHELQDVDYPTQAQHVGRQDRLLRSLEDRWHRVRKAQAVIDADFRKAHLARIEAVKAELDEALQKTLREEAVAKLDAWAAHDAAETKKYLDEMYALLAKKAA